MTQATLFQGVNCSSECLHRLNQHLGASKVYFQISLCWCADFLCSSPPKKFLSLTNFFWLTHFHKKACILSFWSLISLHFFESEDVSLLFLIFLFEENCCLSKTDIFMHNCFSSIENIHILNEIFREFLYFYFTQFLWCTRCTCRSIVRHIYTYTFISEMLLACSVSFWLWVERTYKMS